MFDKKMSDGEFCPLIKDACIRHKCAWFMKVSGKDPQSEKMIDNFGCAIAWLPILTIENSQQQRATAATVDKLASETRQHRREFVAALSPEAQDRARRTPKLMEGTNGDY